jgi:hypothetical protein
MGYELLASTGNLIDWFDSEPEALAGFRGSPTSSLSMGTT